MDGLVITGTRARIEEDAAGTSAAAQVPDQEDDLGGGDDEWEIAIGSTIPGLPDIYYEFRKLVDLLNVLNEESRALVERAEAMDDADDANDEIGDAVMERVRVTSDKIAEISTVVESHPECVWALHDAALDFEALQEHLESLEAAHMALFEGTAADAQPTEEQQAEEAALIDQLGDLEEMTQKATERLDACTAQVVEWMKTEEAPASPATK